MMFIILEFEKFGIVHYTPTMAALSYLSFLGFLH